MSLRQIAPYLAYFFITFIGWTSRIIYEGLSHVKETRKSGGFIYALWHQRQVFFTYTHRGTDCHSLVSNSKDGQIIAKILELSSLGTIRGSSSKSGSEAMRTMLEILDRGEVIAFTPDGPNGPARQVTRGILFLALKSGRPIIPSANSVSRRLELKKSWDRFHVPLPFSRICIAHAPPIYVKSEDDFERAGLELKESLDRVTALADQVASGR